MGKQTAFQKECIYGSMQQEDMEMIINSDIAYEQYQNTSVFITGGTGFIGSSLVKCLLCGNRERGLNIRIIVAVRDEEKARKIYGDLLERKDLELYIGDITEEVHYEGNLDYIFHTASITASKTMVEHPVCTIETAYKGTRHILELAKEKKVKGVVYVSSMEVYGNPDPSIEKVGEKDLGYIDIENVRSSYSEGKRICECLCTAYASEYDVPVKSARLAQTFGAGILENDNRVYVQFAKSAVKGNDIVLHTEGTSDGNYCYIRDVIRALLILGYKGNRGEAYNIVNEDSHMQIREMAKLVAEKVAQGKIALKFDVPKSTLAYGYAPAVKMRLSGAKMRALGWVPEVGMEESYKRMIHDMLIGME
ncbi:MAG: NAD-dependent epimerase/dehydratase family protein [Muricomes sp.]